MEELLKEIGLTEGETRVYLTLLKLGPTKTGPLAKEAGVSSSKVYPILDRLQEKGLAGRVIKGKATHFTAMKPERLVEYMDNKEKELAEKKELVKKMLPELEGLTTEEGPQATMFEGYKAVTNYIRSIIDELEPGESYSVIGANYGAIPGLRSYFWNHHKRRSDKGIKMKMLANYDIKDRLPETARLNSEVRFLPQYLSTIMQIAFYRNKVWMAIWTEEPIGFLIESDEAVKSFKAYFDVFWKMGKED